MNKKSIIVAIAFIFSFCFLFTIHSTAAPSQKNMTLKIAGKTIPYKNGGRSHGQEIINKKPKTTVSTWGGAPIQSTRDNKNTHFIGHNPGAFSMLPSTKKGDKISVTDYNGAKKTYTVKQIFKSNRTGMNIQTQKEEIDLIIGTKGGERITLQACLNRTINIIVIAYA